MTKRLLYPLGLVASLALVVGVARVIAAPPGSVYTPGETLAPTCAPGDSNCTVTAPMAAVTPGDSGNVLTSNGTAWTSAAPAGGGFDWAISSVYPTDHTVLPGEVVVLVDTTDAVRYLTLPAASAGVRYICAYNAGPGGFSSNALILNTVNGDQFFAGGGLSPSGSVGPFGGGKYCVLSDGSSLWYAM